ncbi:hypothetical protein [Arthrobacter woluwensis]|uniref:hypothetical protein n=1 Tax=Arthrobacter woluwensis TaxID=156980 RepID=UPI0011A9B2EA|nr:hypothetical protein [Arthrobacter woluwensis]
MSSKKHLRAAGPEDEAAEAAKLAEPLTVASAATKSHLLLLCALRDKIADQIDTGVPPRDLAALSKRLVDLAKEIEALEAKEAQEDEEERSQAEAGVKAGGNRWEGPTAI